MGKDNYVSARPKESKTNLEVRRLRFVFCLFVCFERFWTLPSDVWEPNADSVLKGLFL